MSRTLRSKSSWVSKSLPSANVGPSRSSSAMKALYQLRIELAVAGARPQLLDGFRGGSALRRRWRESSSCRRSSRWRGCGRRAGSPRRSTRPGSRGRPCARGDRGSRPPRGRSRRASPTRIDPSWGWFLTTSRSASSSSDACSTRSGHVNFPISCNSAAERAVSRSLSDSPRSDARAASTGDRRRVASRGLVAHAEGPDQRAQDAELEADELARAGLELLGALLRAQQRHRQVLEDRQQHDRRDQQGQAGALVGDHEHRRERARRRAHPGATG